MGLRLPPTTMESWRALISAWILFTIFWTLLTLPPFPLFLVTGSTGVIVTTGDAFTLPPAPMANHRIFRHKDGDLSWSSWATESNEYNHPSAGSGCNDCYTPWGCPSHDMLTRKKWAGPLHMHLCLLVGLELDLFPNGTSGWHELKFH